MIRGHNADVEHSRRAAGERTRRAGKEGIVLTVSEMIDDILRRIRDAQPDGRDGDNENPDGDQPPGENENQDEGPPPENTALV